MKVEEDHGPLQAFLSEEEIIYQFHKDSNMGKGVPHASPIKTVLHKKSDIRIHCKYLNARFECNDIVIFVYSHYPFDQNAKTFDTKGKTFSII